MPPSSSARRANGGAWLLIRSRGEQLRNVVDQQLRDAPFQTLAVVALLVLIWSALYLLLDTVLQQVSNWPLVGVVAKQQIFVNFFFVLGAMLTFSNAILAFGSLYSRDEAGALMTMPVHARHVVFVKWFEGLLLSSWSFMLLGIPLMLAVAAQNRVDWQFYPLFTGHFLGFVLIPATLGVLLAWLVALFAPRSPLTLTIWIAAILVAVTLMWLWRIFQAAAEADEWLRRVLSDLSFTQSVFVPTSWTAKGVSAAVERRMGDSLFYLGVVAANAAFLTWLTINLSGMTWTTAFSRAQHDRAQPTIRRGWVTELICNVLFFYLSPRLKTIMLKDIRGFARDATQWTQMAIMLGLLVLYAANLHRLPMDVTDTRMQALVTFLNLTTVSLILATFTSRFVYPLLSLETQQLWLLGLLPVPRLSLLMVKFAFAITITCISGLVVMGLAITTLDLPALWARLNIAACLGVCLGLSGLAVGLGARYPVLGQRNAARIASGVGGSVNLIASFVFVAAMMTGMGAITIAEVRDSSGLPDVLSPYSVALISAMMALSVVVATLSIWIGARHFKRFEA